MSETHLALTPGQLREVLTVLHAYAPRHSAKAFGSRVRLGSEVNALKSHADLDIALTGSPLALHEMFALRDAFSESDLPFRVDVLMSEDLPAYWLNAISWVDLTPKQ